MKILIIGIVLMISISAGSQVNEKIQALDDYTDVVKIGLNSFPGKNEELIEGWIERNKPQKPFYIRIIYGTNAGATADGKPINAAAIYIVNPLKKSGYLWWKRSQFHVLKEPDWTLFLRESKPLKGADVEKLNLLLQ